MIRYRWPGLGAAVLAAAGLFVVAPVFHGTGQKDTTSTVAGMADNARSQLTVFDPATQPADGSSRAMDSKDPSGQPPPTEPGYTMTYKQEFTASSIPADWGAYSGPPGGETASQGNWEPSMCRVSGGELHMMASGVNSCGLGSYVNGMTDGLWLVRMKGNAEPPGRFSDIALLWPTNNSWDAEIDFYEDLDLVGTRTQYNASMYACPDGGCLHTVHSIPDNGTQWHTYGVKRTPTQVTYYLDGKIVAQFKVNPKVPMYLDLQSEDLNGSPVPAGTETMTVDWAAEYTPSS